MKVRELMAQLASLDPDFDVVCYAEDGQDHPFAGQHLYAPLGVAAMAGQRARDDHMRPRLILGAGVDSDQVALLETTRDF